MGVDIHFGAEVRKKDKKWQPVVWYSKTDKPDDDGEYGGNIVKDGIETHFYIWVGRAYHYTDALEDMDAYHGYPDDMSDELKKLMPDDQYVSKGYLTYTKLVKYINDREKQLLSDLTLSRDFQLVKHIHRIEKAVLGKPIKDKISTTYLADYSMKQIYDEYMDDLYGLIKIRNVIYYLADEIGNYPRDEDIRIIYFMC